MSNGDERRQRITAKIEASQQRLDRDSVTLPLPPEESAPPDSVTGLLGEYPGLAIAAGLGAGLLLGAALPKSFGAGLTRRAGALLSAVSETALLLAPQALAGSPDAEPAAATPAESAPFRAAGAKMARKALAIAAKARR